MGSSPRSALLRLAPALLAPLATLVVFAPLAAHAVVVPGDTGRLEVRSGPLPHTRTPPSVERFEKNEVWLLRDRETWERLVRDGQLPADVAAELLRLPRLLNSLPEQSDVYRRAVSASKRESLRHLDCVVFEVPQSLRARLPKAFVERVYREQSSDFYSLPSIEFNFEREIEAYFNERQFAPEQRTEFRAQLIEINKRELRFFFTPTTAQALPSAERTRLAEEWDVSRNGLEPELTLTDTTDPDAVARKYAGARDPAPIARYLRILRERHGPGEFTIPLRTILHSFIRKNVNTRARCDGPNCINTAKNLDRPPSLQSRHQEWNYAIAEMADQFRVVAPGEPLRTGDFMLYTVSGTYNHAMTYIDTDLAFTKTGYRASQPYQFDQINRLETAIYRQGDVQLYVFRRVQNGETPMGDITRGPDGIDPRKARAYRTVLGDPPPTDLIVLPPPRVPRRGPRAPVQPDLLAPPGIGPCAKDYVEGIARAIKPRKPKGRSK